MTSPRDESPTGTSKVPSSDSNQAVIVVLGTRPEAIKLCPLISALRNPVSCSNLRTVVCITAQHRRMLDQVLAAFEVAPDYDLDIMQSGQSLTALTSRVLASLEPIFNEVKPSLSIVQGDTTTALAASLAAFYANVPIAHVEAGLRTFDIRAPFPEEMNRVFIGRLAALHFSPTKWAADNLLREGVAPQSIEITGNTGIDAVLRISDALEHGRIPGASLSLNESKKLIVVTAHRRESFGDPLARICDAISVLAGRPDLEIVWPVHPNPQVRGTVNATLRGCPNVTLIDPLDYLSFVDLMRKAYLLITDSGGVQEEGPSLGKPILVLRDKTERPEAVDCGTVKMVGTDRNAIIAETVRLLEDRTEYERMARLHNPYGDGKASARIARRIAAYLSP